MNAVARNRRWGLLGLIVVCFLSIPLHFFYDWTGENTFIGLFAPINESIWEHLKLVFWPLLVWWTVGFIFYKKEGLSFNKWFTAAAAAIFLSMFVIVAWYYIWKGALAVESTAVDLSALFIAVSIGQLVAIHVYRVITPRTLYMVLALLFIAVTGAAFIGFTLAPPDFPIFMPPN